MRLPAFFKTFLAISLGLSFSMPWAQNFPSKPIKLIIPATSGTSDVIARALAPRLSTALGQSVVVEQMPGAGTNIGNQFVAKAAPDGHTLLINGLPLVTNLALYDRLPYNPMTDLVPVIQLADVTNVVTVHPSLGVQTMKELVQLAKAKPGQISFAYASTSQQVSSEMLASMGGIKMNPVPYKSGPAAMTDLIGGQVNMFTADFAVMVPQVKGGKVRGLAVTSTKRSSVVPDLPTVNEALGLKDYELIAYFAIFAPAGTPPEAIARLNKAINNAANAKDVQEKLSSFGLVIDPGTPEDLAKRNQAESIKWSKAIRDAKIEPQ